MKVQVGKTTSVQFLTFVFVGLVSAIIMLAVYYIFLWINPAWYLVGNIVGWIASVANAYILNHRFTFKEKSLTRSETLKKLGKSYLSYGATFCLSIFLLWVEVDILKLSALLCPMLNILIATPLNFILNKFWTFSK